MGRQKDGKTERRTNRYLDGERATEGLFDHEPNLLDTKETPADKPRDGHDRVADLAYKRDRQHEAPNRKEAARVPGVVERHRCLHQPLARADKVIELFDLFRWCCRVVMW